MRPVRRRLGGGLLVLSTAAISPLLASACANGLLNGIVDAEAGVDLDAATRDVNVLPGRDSSTPDDDDGGKLPGDDAGGTCTKKVVINELKTDGPGANDEMIELFNPSSCAVPLGNWELKYQSSGGGNGLAGYKFATGDSIAANAYLIVAPANAPKKDAILNPGMAAGSGQVGLLDDTGKVIDAVAYGSVTMGDYREAQSAPTPPSGGSIGRSPNGGDTDDNKGDFRTYTTPSAGVANP